jgi:hypothetical protein
MKNARSFDIVRFLVIVNLLLCSTVAIVGCNEEQIPSDLKVVIDNGDQNPDNIDGGSNTGGGDNILPTGTLKGTVDTTLISDTSCSAGASANAVYIYKGSTVVAVDQSGSNSDPIEIAVVSPNQNSDYAYSISVPEGIYTIAFTCQADADIPDQAGDSVTFREVTNVVVQSDQESTHNFTVSNQSSGGLNAVIQQMPANSWYEVPNSQMDAVKADFPYDLPGNIDGLLAYSGAAFDTKRNRLIVWGGGHNNYYGNEVYTFDLTDFTWERITEPSPPTTKDACVAILADGNPNSRHTYFNLDYIPEPVDKFFSTPGGSTSCNSGGGDRNTWTFDFDTKKWLNMESTGEAVISWAPTESAYDPINHKVYSTSPGGLYSYDVESNHWQRLNSTAIRGDRGVAVDTKRHLLVVVGHGEVVVYDIGNEDYKPQFWNTTGGEFNVSGYRPGVNYDPVADRVVVWDGGAVQALDMDNKEWTALAVAPQEPYSVGTYGRFRYSPIENAYVVVNSAYENVLVYKLTEGGGKK